MRWDCAQIPPRHCWRVHKQISAQNENAAVVDFVEKINIDCAIGVIRIPADRRFCHPEKARKDLIRKLLRAAPGSRAQLSRMRRRKDLTGEILLIHVLETDRSADRHGCGTRRTSRRKRPDAPVPDASNPGVTQERTHAPARERWVGRIREPTDSVTP